MVDDPDYTREELMDVVIAKMDSIYSDNYGWEMDGGRDHFVRDIENFTDDALEYMAESDMDEFTDLANYGFDEGMDEPPDWLLEMGWYDDDGDWHNPFWYH